MSHQHPNYSYTQQRNTWFVVCPAKLQPYNIQQKGGPLLHWVVNTTHSSGIGWSRRTPILSAQWNWAVNHDKHPWFSILSGIAGCLTPNLSGIRWSIPVIGWSTEPILLNLISVILGGQHSTQSIFILLFSWNWNWVVTTPCTAFAVRSIQHQHTSVCQNHHQQWQWQWQALVVLIIAQHKSYYLAQHSYW